MFASRGADTYLIETKWRRTKADINDIDSLFTRLAAAPSTVVGLMVSYAGFTDSAIEKVEQRSDRPVLLMTGSELARLVEWDDDLAHFLSQKKASLLTRRKVFFATARRRRVAALLGGLATTAAEFAFPNGSRAKWMAGEGRFGEFTFVQELPDIDWDSIEGRGVTLDMPVPVCDEAGILALLQRLSDMGWATGSARWSIQQSSTNWHGMGTSAFAEALQGWEERYTGISTHHSEEFCYYDKCDGGFYCLTSKISAYEDRSASYTMLSFQLAGIPLDTEALKELTRQWSGLIAPLAGSAVDNLLAQADQHGERFMFALAVPETLSVVGGQLPLGSVLHIMHSTRIANLDEVRAWRQAGTGSSIDVQLEPGGNRDMTVRPAPANPPALHDQPLAS